MKGGRPATPGEATKPVKLVYILGHAYSGTTLFSLALGNEEEILNLGEVSSLENDYHDQCRCSCGVTLKECPFWASIEAEIDRKQQQTTRGATFQLTASGKAELLDRRGRNFLENMGLGLGLPLMWVYGTEYVKRYREKNENFFQSVANAFPSNDILVDCSKSPERLAALLGSKRYDLKCIYLKRSDWAVAASRLKRVKKRQHSTGFLVSLKYMLWQRRREARIRRVLERLPNSHRMVVKWENFVADPTRELSRVRAFLDLKPKQYHGNDSYGFRTDLQHVYVGNRWLFDTGRKRVELQLRDDIHQLASRQRLAVRFVFGKPAPRGVA